MNNNKFNLDKLYFAFIEDDVHEVLESQRRIDERLNRILLSQLLMSYESCWIDRDEYLDKVESIWKGNLK